MKRKDQPLFSALKKKCETVSGLLKVMAHPQRLLILCSLIEGEKTVHEIETACGASQSAVSQFLKVMRLEGLIKSRREGRFVFYRIADTQMNRLVQSLQDIYCR